MNTFTTDSQGNVSVPTTITYSPTQIAAHINDISTQITETTNELASHQSDLTLWQSYQTASQNAISQNTPKP